MQPLTTVPEYIAYVKARPDLPMCPIRLVLRSIGGKWKLLIVLHLFGASALRFSALRRGIGDITNSMLSSCLQELEGEGIVTRTQYEEIPPRVEYALTPKGESLAPVILALANWGLDHEGD